MLVKLTKVQIRYLKAAIRSAVDYEESFIIANTMKNGADSASLRNTRKNSAKWIIRWQSVYGVLKEK